MFYNKRWVRISFKAVCCAIIAAVLVFVVFEMLYTNSGGVKVGKDVELTETVTEEEFAAELKKLIDEYDDEQTVIGERSTNRLLLRFEGSTLDLRDFLADKVISKEDNRVVIQFSDEEEALRCLEILKNTSGIIYVEEDQYEEAINSKTTAPTTGQQYYEKYISEYSDDTYYSWGVVHMRLDMLNAWIKENRNDNEVTVAVIDSGVVPNSETEDRILNGIDFVKDGDGTTDIVGGHGTHVSGVVLDATQGLNVNILPIRVVRYRSAVKSAVTSGIIYAVEKGADVINMSIGGQHSEAEDDAIREAVNAGVTVVVSAGNESMDTSTSCPAHMEECIVVSAYGLNSLGEPEIASFSNYGSSVTLSAPGVDVLSYWKDDSNVDEQLRENNWSPDEDDGFRGTNQLDNGIYVEFSDGTSMAAPHISALAAMIKMILPDATPVEVKKYIESYCVDMGDSAHFGAGVCDAGMLAGN